MAEITFSSCREAARNANDQISRHWIFGRREDESSRKGKWRVTLSLGATDS